MFTPATKLGATHLLKASPDCQLSRYNIWTSNFRYYIVLLLIIFYLEANCQLKTSLSQTLYFKTSFKRTYFITQLGLLEYSTVCCSQYP